jgi:hypothetical protein
MATLIGTVPPGSTFQDLVGVTTPRRVAASQPPREQSLTAIRIYLPESLVRLMVLTRREEFLVSYSIQDNRPGSKPFTPHKLGHARG